MKFAHVTINVKNLEESVKFYEEIVFLGQGETLVELIHDSTKNDISIGSDISIGFAVNSLDETINIIKEKALIFTVVHLDLIQDFYLY